MVTYCLLHIIEIVLPLGPLWHYCHHKQPQSSSCIHSSFPSGIPGIAGISGTSSEERFTAHYIHFSSSPGYFALLEDLSCVKASLQDQFILTICTHVILSVQMFCFVLHMTVCQALFDKTEHKVHVSRLLVI